MFPHSAEAGSPDALRSGSGPGALDPGRIRAGLAAALFGFLVVWACHGGYFSSNSVDIANHFLVVNKLQTDGALDNGYVLNLGGMVIYSPVAHWVASGLAGFAGSGLLAMNFLAILALYACWVIVAFALYRIHPAALVGALALLVPLAIFGRRLPVMGLEISKDNYYYSQIVAQALLMAVLYLVIRSRSGFRTKLLVLTASVALGFCINSLVTVIVFGAGFVYLAWLWWTGGRQKSWTAGLAAYAVAGILMFLFNPYAKSMVLIAGFNGGLSLSLFADSNLGLSPAGFALPVVGLGVSVYVGAGLWRRRLEDNGYGLFFCSSILFSASGLALVQIGLLLLGTGSNYAVKKYFFIIFTFLILVAAGYAAGRWLKPRLAGGRLERLAGRWSALLIAGLPFLMCFFMLRDHVTDIHEVRRLQAVASHVHEMYSDAEQYHATMTQFAVPGHINYLISLCDMELALDDRVIRALNDDLASLEPDKAGKLWILAAAEDGLPARQTIGRYAVYDYEAYHRGPGK